MVDRVLDVQRAVPFKAGEAVPPVLICLKGLICGFWVPIAFALLLNELRHLKFKKTCRQQAIFPILFLPW